jgi:hypothetical protein
MLDLGSAEQLLWLCQRMSRMMEQVLTNLQSPQLMQYNLLVIMQE